MPPALPASPVPTAPIPPPLAANIQRYFLGSTSGGAVPAPPRRQQGAIDVQGEKTQFPRVKASAAGTGPVGP